MRTATVHRATSETRVDVEINLDGTGSYAITTGVGFFDHMLEQLSRHSLIDLKITTVGDLHIYAMGDCASFVCPIKGTVPPRAQAAHQQALFLAEVLAGPEPATPPLFQYRDYGSLVSLGPLSAVGVLTGYVGKRKLQVGGVVARVLYALMYRKHLMALHGFARMAAQTLADWIRDRLAPSVKLH